MEYKDFLAKCKEIYADDFTGDGNLEEKHYNENFRWHREDNKVVEKPRLIVEWSTGGYSGGSCWDDSDPQPYDSKESPKELVILDAILKVICPATSFLQYRMLTDTLVKYDTYSIGEYYGNSTDYARKTVDLQELFNFLKEEGLIE